MVNFRAPCCSKLVISGLKHTHVSLINFLLRHVSGRACYRKVENVQTKELESVAILYPKERFRERDVR